MKISPPTHGVKKTINIGSYEAIMTDGRIRLLSHRLGGTDSLYYILDKPQRFPLPRSTDIFVEVLEGLFVSFDLSVKMKNNRMICTSICC